MSVDFLVILLMWVGAILSSLFLTPKNCHRRLLFATILCQTFTWLNSLILVKLGLLSFPAREFPHASELPFTLKYLFYPLICGFYIIYQPKKNKYYPLLYQLLWVSSLTILEVLMEKYTNLIKYIDFTWYWSWIDIFCLFTITNIIYKWFFHDKTLFREDREIVR